MYYYSIQFYTLNELEQLLQYCKKRYQGANIKIACNMTYCWIKSNKDLYYPITTIGELLYKYRELTTEPNPQRNWTIKWIPFKEKLNNIKKVLKQ